MDNCQTEPKPILANLGINPFGDAALSNEELAAPVHQNASTNWLDLLTGDNMMSESISQPVMEASVHEGGGFLDFDKTVVEHVNGEINPKLASSQDNVTSDSCVQQYINCFKFLAGTHMVRS